MPGFNGDPSPELDITAFVSPRAGLPKTASMGTTRYKIGEVWGLRTQQRFEIWRVRNCAADDGHKKENRVGSCMWSLYLHFENAQHHRTKRKHKEERLLFELGNR